MQAASDTAAKRRWLPGALLAAGAAAAALEARRLGLGSASQPGAGFFPFWLSVALALVALLLSAGVGRGSPPVAAVDEPQKSSTSVQSFLVLCLYCALLIPLGFIPATLLFFLLQARTIERLAWPRAALQGAAATAAAYGLFALLGVRLPAGLWLE